MEADIDHDTPPGRWRDWRTWVFVVVVGTAVVSGWKASAWLPLAPRPVPLTAPPPRDAEKPRPWPRPDDHPPPHKPVEDPHAVDRLLWTVDLCDPIDHAAIVGDLDADGSPDVAVWTPARGGKAALHALSGVDGSCLWTASVDLPGVTAIASSDADLDGVPDVLVRSGPDAFAFSGRDGALVAKIPNSLIEDATSPADLDGDAYADRIVVHDGSRLDAVAHTARLVWEATLPSQPIHEPAVADLDGDHVDDIVAALTDGSLVALSGKDGAILWRAALPARAAAPPAVGDVEGDGKADLFVGTAGGDLVACSGRDGRELWRLPVLEKGESGAVWNAARTAELDGDGAPDLLVASEAGELCAVSGRTGAAIWTVRLPSAPSAPPLLGAFGKEQGLRAIVPLAAFGEVEECLAAYEWKDGAAAWTCEGRALPLAELAHSDHDTVDDILSLTPRGASIVAGFDGRVTYSWDSFGAGPRSVAWGDLDGGGLLGTVAGSATGWLARARSARERRSPPYWSLYLGGEVVVAAEATDLDGDARRDVVAGGAEGVCAVAGKDGTPLWAWRWTGGAPFAISVADLDHDGTVEAVVLGPRVQVLRTEPWDCGASDVDARLNRLRRLGLWEALAHYAGSLRTPQWDEVQCAAIWVHRGLARAALGHSDDVLADFYDARHAGLRSPEAAVYEWLASRMDDRCPLATRTEVRRILEEAIMAHPDAVVEAFAETRDLFTQAVLRQTKEALDSLRDQTSTSTAATLAALAVGLRPTRADLERARTEVECDAAAGKRPLARTLAFQAILGWGLFCVTWAMIEGSILVYVLRIHALLARRPRRGGWGVPLVPLGLLCLYVAYTWGFATVGPRLDEDRIRNLAAFWVKVCAAFWTTFEWAVVIVGFRTYALLRRPA